MAKYIYINKTIHWDLLVNDIYLEVTRGASLTLNSFIISLLDENRKR